MILSQTPCKPVVLDKHASMFGLHHLGRVVTLCLLVGCLVVIACFKIKDGAHLHSFPYSNCMTFVQPLCKPVVLDKLLFICIRLLCVRALPVLYCALHHAHTPESEHELMDGLHPKVLLFFFEKYICYILVVSHNCSYSCLSAKH